MPLMIKEDPNKKNAGTGAKLENAISGMPTQGAPKKNAAASTGMSGSSGITQAPTPDNPTNGTAPTANTGSQQATETPSFKVDETSPWAGFGNALNDQDESKFDSLLPQIWMPGSNVYCPYVTATNVNALTAFGQMVGKDFSAGISKEDYDYYYNLYYNDPTIVRTAPKQDIASPNSLSKEQKKDKNLVAKQTAAYAFKSIADAELTTTGAEEELKAVQDEIKYWVSRTDLNLSDADIRSKVESLVSKSKYLKQMGEAAGKGGATQLNRAVNYADNLIDGMIWAARNEDKAMGTAQFNSIYAAMGVGNKWEERQVNQYQKIDTASYNPYRVGSTMDDLCRKYGVTEFTKEWINNPENAAKLRKDGNYDRVNRAITETEKARAEAEGLTAWVTEMANAGIEIKWDDLYNSHSYGNGKSVQATTLKGMIGTLGQDEDGIRHGNGKLKDTAGVIDFDVDDLKSLYNRIVNEKKYPGYNEAFAGCFGEADAFYTDAAADEAASAALSKFRDVLLTYGTDDDRGLVRVLNGLVDPEQKRQFVEGYVESGALTKQEAMWINYRIAEDYASDNYMANAWIIKNYDEAQKKVDEGMKLLKEMGLEYNPDYEPGQKSWQYTQSEYISNLAENVGYEHPSWLPANSSELFYQVSYLKDLAERIQSNDPSIEDEQWYKDAGVMLPELLGAIVNLPGNTMNENGEWQQANGVDNMPTYADMLSQAKDNTDINKIYGQIRTNQKVLDDYGEKAYNDAKDIVKRIYDNYDIASAYGEVAYGPAEYYADGTGNHAAHMVSWGKEVGDQNLRAMDAILSFGAEDYQATASQTAAQYLMMMSNDIDYIKAQGAAERGIDLDKDPDAYTDEMAREDAANFRAKALKNCNEQLGYIEELEKILDIYHINLTGDSPSGGKMKPYENFLAYKEDMQEIAGFMQTQLDADKDPYFDRYVQEGIKAAREAGGGNLGTIYANLLEGKVPHIGGAEGAREAWKKDTGTSERDWKMFLYLWGKEGRQAAFDYYDYALRAGEGVIEPSAVATARFYAKSESDVREAVNKPGFEGFWNRLTNSAATVVANPVQIAGTVYSTIQRVTGQEIDPDNPAFAATRFVTSTRSAVSEYLNNAYGEAAGFLYDVLMSGIDSSVNAAITGPVLGAFTAGGATTISHLMHVLGGNFASAAPMGLQAMGAAVWSAKMSGASDDEAYAVGLMNFLCETITETITVGNIRDSFASGAMGGIQPHSFGEFLKDLLKDMGEEALGESAAEWGEQWANKYFMGENSDYERAVAEYMELGMSETAARQQAEKDGIHDILMAGLSGALMAAGTSGFHYALGTMKSSIGKFFDGEETYVRKQHAIEEARLKYNIEEIDKKLAAANKTLEKKGGYWAQKSVDYYTGQKERAEKEFTEWKGKSLGIFEYWMQNERGKAQGLENDVIRGSEAVRAMGMPSAEGMEGIGDGYDTMPKDRAEIDRRTQETYQKALEAQQPAIQKAQQQAEDVRTQARKDADTAYEAAMSQAETQLQLEMERIDQADAQTEADFQKQFEAIDSSKKKGTIKAKQTARLQAQYEQWQASRDTNRETAVYNAQNSYYTAVAAAEQARNAAYQEADDAYIGAVETANLNAEEQATNAANAQANRWIDAMTDDAAQTAANKKSAALQTEANAKAEADATYTSEVGKAEEQADKDREAAQKKLEEATAKAEADYKETAGYVGNIEDKDAHRAASDKNDADYNKALDAAHLQYNSDMRSIEDKLYVDRRAAAAKRDRTYADAAAARGQAEAEADNEYNAAMEAIGKRYDNVPAVNASDAANDWQVSTEQFQKALDGFESAVQIGGKEDINAAGHILHETASGVMDALNGIKASIQAEIEASGKPMTEAQSQRLNAVQTTADWVQAILDYADGKQAEPSAENVPVNAQTEPVGQPAPAAEPAPATETAPVERSGSQVSYSFPVETEEDAPAGTDYTSIVNYLKGPDSRFDSKKMADRYTLTDEQCKAFGIKTHNKAPVYATYLGVPGRYYGDTNSGLFIPLDVDPTKVKTLETLELRGAEKVDYFDLELETYNDGSIGAVEVFNGHDPYDLALNKAKTKAKTEPVGKPVNVQQEVHAKSEAETTPAQENAQPAQPQAETPARPQEEITPPATPAQAETEPAGEPAGVPEGAQPEGNAPKAPGINQVNNVPGASPAAPPAAEPTRVEPVGAPAAVQEGSGFDFDKMRKPYLLDKKEQKKLGIDSSVFFYATHNGTLGRFYGTEESGGTFVPLEINPKAAGSRNVLKSMPGVVEVKPGAVKAAGIQTYSIDSAEAVAIFNGQDPATATANDRNNVPAGVNPQVNAEPKGGAVNENGEQETPKSPKQTGLTLDDLINGFKESAADAFNTVKDALNSMRRQQETKEQNQNEVNARAIVLDAYNTVQDLINQAKEWYERWVSLTYSGDKNGAKEAQDKVSELYDKVTQAWDNYRMYNGLLDEVTSNSGKRRQTTNPEAADPASMAIVALNKAEGSGDTAVQFTTVSAVLNRKPVNSSDANSGARAGATTQALFDVFGITDTFQGLRHVFADAYRSGTSLDTVKSAITTLALGGDQGTNTLRQMFNGNLSAAAGVQAAIDLAPSTQGILNRKVTDYQKAIELRRLISQGGLAETKQSEEKRNQAIANVGTAQDALDVKINESQQRQVELQDAMAEYERAQSMTDRDPSSIRRKRGKRTNKEAALETTAAAVNAATQSAGNAMTMVNNYRRGLENAQQAAASEKHKYEDAVSGAMQRLRAQATMNVNQANAENERRMAEEKAARDAEAAAQLEASKENAQNAADTATTEAERERQSRNADTMDADAYIEKYHKDASEEEKEEIRKAFNEERSKRTDNGDDDATRTRFVRALERKFGVNIQMVDSSEGGTKMPYNGKYDRETNTIYLDKNATQGDAIYAVALHELTHSIEDTGLYKRFANILLDMKYGTDQTGKNRLQRDIQIRMELYNKRFERMAEADKNFRYTPLDSDGARKEIVADLTRELLYGNQKYIDGLVDKDPNLGRRILNAISRFLKKMRGVNDPALERMENARKMFESALKEAKKQMDSGARPMGSEGDVLASGKDGEALVRQFNGGTVAAEYSFGTWTEEEKSKVVNALRKSGLFTDEQISEWIDNVDSVGAIIGANRSKLDFVAAQHHKFMKPNAEYVVTIDASTLCAKRLLYQGIFNEIQHRMPNTVFTPKDLTNLRNLMDDLGKTVPCGICYVESRRKWLDKFAKKWLDSYDGAYKPKMDELSTSDGLERLRKNHPDVYDDFVTYMKTRGSANPKLVELRTEYRGDIRSLTPGDIEKIIRIGGLRIQSFSDFETPHLMDMMQAVMDMASMNLTAQAYTKVPNFAWVFGDTGIKINLSLIGKGTGLDENGNLLFDSKEGMDIDEAVRLRNRYSKNVGTILVGMNDAHIKAAMADPRIDFIIPFHKSGWKKSELKVMRSMEYYDDYTKGQNERRFRYDKNGKRIKPVETDMRTTAKIKEGNFYPVDYWEYNKTGKENAEIYLKKCAEDGRIPKFARFLVDNGDGSYSLQPDGSTDGYWKLLIDFKMYDNAGVGSEQTAVVPNFNMDEAMRVLNDYAAGDENPNELPVDTEVVDAYVDQYKKKYPREQYSLPGDEQSDAGRIQYSITGEDLIDADDEKREQLLRNGTIRIAQKKASGNALTNDEVGALTVSKVSDAEKALINVLKRFKAFGKYDNQLIDLEFDFTGNGARESTHNQRDHRHNLLDLATIAENLPEIVANAVPIETHKDKYAGTIRADQQLERVYVLLSAYESKSGEIIPIELEVKQFSKRNNNRLYSVVTLNKIGTADDGVTSASDNSVAVNNSTAVPEISIPILVSQVNPSEGFFLKYIPDGMLNSEQIESKRDTIREENEKIEKLRQGIRQYSLPSDETLREHIRAYLNGELDETDTMEPGNVQARAGFKPNTSREFKATSDLGKPVHSPYQISRTLAHDLGIGDYIGTRKMNNMPRAVAGYYQTHAKYVAVRTRDAGTYGTTMHELGHAIADILGMVGTDSMVDAMTADPQGLDLSRYTDDDLKHEAFAEFAWRWFEGEQRARDFAGDDFTDQFERALREHGIDKQVQKAADEIRMWANASTGDMIESTIQHKSNRPKQGTLFERMRDSARTALARTVDATSAAERLNHTIRDESGNRDIYIGIDVRSQMLLNQTAGKRAYNILMNNLTDARWNRIGEGLAPRLERTGITTKEYPILEAYMLAKHSVARDQQGKPVFDNDQLTPQAREEYIRRIEAEHPAVKAAAEAIQSFRKEFLQAMMVDTGYMSQATFDMLNQMYPDYVPTRRVKSDKNDSGRPNGSKSKYEIRRATGSTEDIWSPIDTMADMVNSVVKMVSANNAAYAWHVAYGMYEGLGEYGRRITPDMVKQTFNTDALQRKIQDLIQDNVDSDVLDEVMKAINDARTQYKMKDGSSLDNVIEVQLPDGTKALYQMKDMELYNLMAQVNESSHGKGLEMVGKITKGMSALTTGSNPIFAVRNFLRDFQNSVNYGSWASNYVTGAFKWLLAFWDVWRTNSPLLAKFGVNPSEAYQDYVALGGGGYNRIDTESKKGARELRAGLVSRGSNTENIGSIGRYVGKKLWNTMTLQALNEYVEQASRFAEYRFGKHNLNTGEGRTQAYLAAQDVTVDFGRRGYGRTAGVLKQIVPFFNASLQGVYRTTRMLSEGERSRALPRFMKTVLNTGITSAICAALLKGLLDDDAQEEFDMLSDGLKAGHFYLPNFMPDVLGDYPLIRIPLEQDPLAIAVHGMTTALMWGKTPDGYVLSMAATADAVLQNLNPIGSMIYDPLIDVQTNKNYYGGNITPTRQDGDYVTTQYSEDIPDVFVEAARLMDRLPIEGLNAYQIQYLAQQYTGFLGQMLIPAITKDNGKLGGINAAIRAAQKRITSDPLLSNDCVGAFYDARSFLGQVTSAYDGQKLGDVFQDMDPNDYAACANMAESLTKNVINPMYKEIKAYNTQIDDINGNETLTDKQKYELTSSIRRDMLKRVMQANEQIGVFYDTYVRAPSLTNQLIFGKHYFKRK